MKSLRKRSAKELIMKIRSDFENKHAQKIVMLTIVAFLFMLTLAFFIYANTPAGEEKLLGRHDILDNFASEYSIEKKSEMNQDIIITPDIPLSAIEGSDDGSVSS